MLKQYYKGYEVFVAGTDDSGPLYVCGTIKLLNEWLKDSCTLTMDTGMRAFQGFLTSAETIPGDLRGKNAYIIIEDPDEKESGIILDNSFDDPDFVVSEVESIVGNSIGSIINAEMENVFILYGHEIPISISVSEDDIDEEIMDVCKKLAMEAIEIQEKQ